MYDFMRVSSFDRQDRLDRFKGIEANENILSLLNENTAFINKYIEKHHSRVYRSSILITGAPRSGSTWLYQLMASKLDCAYVSNLMARFYSSPFVGAWLQSELITKEIKELSSFESEHGLTRRVYEPHEFGYFWSQHLPFHSNNHQEVDAIILKASLESLEYKLATISGIFRKPVIYKCMIAPFVLRAILENTSVFVVHIRRNILDVIRSVIEVRKERLGDCNKWWSIRPACWQEIECLPPVEQVRIQCESVVSAIEDVAADARYKSRIIDVHYEDLLKDQDMPINMINEKFQLYLN